MALLKIRKKEEKTADLESIPQAQSHELGISDAAALWVEKLMKESGKPFLRVAIKGGGCSGLTIHYELSDKTRADDQEFTKDQAKVVMDKKSLSILGGATLHTREYLGAKELYLANNPAEKQCSCGQSFSM